MTTKLQAVLSFLEGRVDYFKNGLLKFNAKQEGNTFTNWASLNFTQVVSYECAMNYWKHILDNVQGRIGNGKTDKDIFEFLRGYRASFVWEILNHTVLNSSNPIANEIDVIQQDTLKEIVGSDCVSSYSLSCLLFEVFGYNVKEG